MAEEKVTCPRCHQPFRQELDPKLGELVPIGSKAAIELVEEFAANNRALQETIRHLRSRIDQLETQLKEARAQCDEARSLADWVHNSHAREIIELMAQSRRLRLEANSKLDEFFGDERVG